MKVNFKPMGLAAAVAAVTAGYAGVTSAASIPTNGLGDLAIIPYYTVQESWGTGVHIINTSARTQVVKLRLRRASDSLDALDLNLIMSPEDEWTGFLNDTDGTIRLTTQDTTCTAPLPTNGGFTMPAIYREGADEGYWEVISMGATVSETSAVAKNARHKDGVPKNCLYVEENFLDGLFPPGSTPTDETLGMLSASQSQGQIDDIDGDTTIEVTDYNDGGNVLKVSWFIRDAGTGIEFGDDAEHVADFETATPMMTNQEFGVFSGVLHGFDFPDLNGGSPAFNGNLAGAGLGKYLGLRDTFGVSAIINDWSDNPDLSVGTDWVITIPGQYTMVDMPLYLATNVVKDPDAVCEATAVGDELACDMRDIPVTASFFIWDREEDLLTVEGDRGVVVSPSIPGQIPTTQLKYEVNVIHWAPNRQVLESDYDIDVDTSLLDAVSGWAKLKVTSKAAFGVASQAVCEWTVPGYDPRPGAPGDPNDLMVCDIDASASKAPMIGFVAWERSFPENPDGAYGRAVGHSFESGS
jgi:hypothetical protein